MFVLNSKKKIFVFFLLLVFVITSINSMAYIEEKSEYTKTVFLNGFSKAETDVVGNVTEGPNISYSQIDEEHGDSIILNSKGGASAFRAEGSIEPDAELTLFSFDMYIKDSTIVSIVNVLNGQTGSDFKRAFVSYKNGTLQYNDMSKGNNAMNYAERIGYSVNTWNHVDIWVDYRNNNALYYINGSLFGTSPLSEDFTRTGTLQVVAEPADGGGIVAVDNISIIQILERGKKLGLNENIAMPEGLEDFAQVNVCSDELGNNFFGKNIHITADVRNNCSSTDDVIVDLKIVSEDGKTEYSAEKEGTIEIENIKSFPFDFEVSKFGFYKIYVSVKSKISGNVIYKTSEFVSINGPEEGKYNEKIGICNHTDMGDEVEGKVDLMYKAGLSMIRDIVRWERFDNGNRQYSFDYYPYYIKELQATKKNPGMEKMIILDGYDPSKPVNYNHITKEEQKNFAEYAYNLALKTKDYTNVFEICNEWSLKEDFDSAYYYTELVKVVAPAVRRANPDAVIYGWGGAANTDYNKWYKWMEDCLKYGMGEYCDGFTIHPYAFSEAPEKANSHKRINDARELLKKYGYEDKELILSEFGWSSYHTGFDDDVQADWTIRWMAMKNKTQDVEKTIWYVSQEKQYSSVGENKFGWIRAWDEKYAAPYVPYEAKPVFLAVANWNTLMTNSYEVKQIQTNSDTVYAYLNKLEDGRNCLIVWDSRTDGISSHTAFKLNTDNVVVCDLYGNERSFSLTNNTIDIELSGRPVYIIGDFSDCSEVEGLYSLSTSKLKVASGGDRVSVMVFKNTNKEVVAELELPDNISIASQSEFDSDNKMTIELDVKESDSNNKIDVILKDKNTGNIIYTNKIDVEYVDSAECKFEPKYFRSGRWQLWVNIKNLKAALPINGKLKIIEPIEFSKYANELYFEGIAPSESKLFKFNIPDTIQDVKVPVKCEIELDTGEKYEISEDIYFAGIAPVVDKAPVIDGVLSYGEWNKEYALALRYDTQIKQISDWQGTEDLSAMVYCMWDKDNFYLCAEVNDDLLGNHDDAGRIWFLDSIQYAFSDSRNKGANRTEYSIGLLDDKPSFNREAFMAVLTDMVGVTDSKEYDGIEVEIKREEGKTIYETKFPWIQIFGREINPSLHKSMNFSLLINDNDGEGRRGWIEFCPGIGSSKDPTKFICLPVMKR